MPYFFLSIRLDGEPALSLAEVEPIDWDKLLIEGTRDDEGRLEIIDDDVMYELLRFRAEDEAAEKARGAANKASSEQTPNSVVG